MANQNTSPPSWLNRLLEWFCAEEFLEVVQGDLHEMYHRNVQEKGKFRANLCYLGDVLDLFRPFALGFNFPYFHITTTGMYRNYLTTAFRNFRRQFGVSLINVLGLAIGMAAFIIILTYVSFELSYDDYHANKNKLYRWVLLPYKPDGELVNQLAPTSPVFAPFMTANMPEVKKVCRLFHCPTDAPFITISHIDEKDKITSFNEEKAYFADPAFLTMFTVHMLGGDTSSLNEPNTVILSESTAERYFGENDPEEIIGQALTIPFTNYIENQYVITGIFEGFPPNTHFQADMLLSYTTLVEANPGTYDEMWINPHMYTYLQLHPHITEEQFLARRNEYINLLNERYQQAKTDPFEVRFEYDVIPVDAIYLHSNLTRELTSGGNARMIYFLLMIGIFIVIIAWVNYVNLSTASAIQRTREVGVRKVIGAGKMQLILQFLSEAFILNLMAALLSWVIVWLSLPFFQQLTGKPISPQLWQEGMPHTYIFYGAFALLFLLSALLSGIYPAWVLSSFKPLKALRGQFISHAPKGISLRSGLVVFQFAISVILIAGTYAVYQQLTYMQNQDLGFEKEQALIIRSPVDDSLKFAALEVFKNELLQQAFVETAATSSNIPGQKINWVKGIGTSIGQATGIVRLISVDDEFLNMYNFNMLAGRTFSEAYGSDGQGIVMSENLVEQLGFENAEAALHEQVWLQDMGEREVIGVAQNYHQSSLKDAFMPVAFLREGATATTASGLVYSFKHLDKAYLSVKMNPSHLLDKMSVIEDKWSEYFAAFPFDYFFLDESFDHQYRAELQFSNIFGTFAGLAIFIAGLGILGLSSYMAAQKSKEIGIRKVLGATVTNIVLLLSSKFVRLVGIATIIALPVAYWVFDHWLENYAFRIDIGWWFFVIPALVVFLIAIITISVQTVKAALANPVDSLKYE